MDYVSLLDLLSTILCCSRAARLESIRRKSVTTPYKFFLGNGWYTAVTPRKEPSRAI